MVDVDGFVVVLGRHVAEGVPGVLLKGFFIFVHNIFMAMESRDLVTGTHILDLVVGVVEQGTQTQIVVLLPLEVDGVGVRVLTALLLEHHLGVDGVVMNNNHVVLVKREGGDDVVVGAIDGGPGTLSKDTLYRHWSLSCRRRDPKLSS